MTQEAALSDTRTVAETRSEVFVDERGRAMRVTWHEDENVVVVSLWRDDTCVGTFKLEAAEVSRLSAFLVESWVEALRRSPLHRPPPLQFGTGQELEKVRPRA